MKSAIVGRLQAAAPFLFFVGLSVAAITLGGDRHFGGVGASMEPAADAVLAFTAPERRLF